MKLPFRGRDTGQHDFDDYEDEDFDVAPPPSRGPIPERPDRPPIGAVPPPAHRGGTPRPNRLAGDAPPVELRVAPPEPARPAGRPAAPAQGAPSVPAPAGPSVPAPARPPVASPAQASPSPAPAVRAPAATSPATASDRVAAGRVVPPVSGEHRLGGRALATGEVAVVMPPEARQGAGTVSADEFASAFEDARSAGGGQGSAWAYLGVLCTLFILTVGFGYGCSGRLLGEPAPIEPSEMLASAEPVRLEFRVDGNLVTMRGAVPDLAAREQLVGLAGEIYGPGNVVDNVTVESNTTFEDGSVRVIGAAELGDERPKTLQERISQEFGLANRGFEVGFTETVLTPVVAVVSISGDRVALSGTLPDDVSVTDLTALAGEVWGPGNVDPGALVVGDTTWTDGRIQLAGTAVATDARVTRFITLVGERIGTLVAVETSGLAAGDSPDTVATQQATINTLILNSPIQFTPQSAELSPESDAVLVEVAAALAQVPVTPVEIVGHTDSLGDEQENQVLSEGRARAVLDRLVSLGVDPARLTSRGMGESAPVADNATEEGQAANRRIEFILVGPPG